MEHARRAGNAPQHELPADQRDRRQHRFGDVAVAQLFGANDHAIECRSIGKLADIEQLDGGPALGLEQSLGDQEQWQRDQESGVDREI